MGNLNQIHNEKVVRRHIQDLGYSLDNQCVQQVYRAAVSFAEIASRSELIQYIEQGLELIPNCALQGDVV